MCLCAFVPQKGRIEQGRVCVSPKQGCTCTHDTRDTRVPQQGRIEQGRTCSKFLCERAMSSETSSVTCLLHIKHPRTSAVPVNGFVVRTRACRARSAHHPIKPPQRARACCVPSSQVPCEAPERVSSVSLLRAGRWSGQKVQMAEDKGRAQQAFRVKRRQ